MTTICFPQSPLSFIHSNIPPHMRGTAPLVISALISVITPVARRVKTYYIQGTVETLQLLRFQKPSTERHNTSVLVWVGFAKKTVVLVQISITVTRLMWWCLKNLRLTEHYQASPNRPYLRRWYLATFVGDMPPVDCILKFVACGYCKFICGVIFCSLVLRSCHCMGYFVGLWKKSFCL